MIPEDSTLRRHYLTEQKYKTEALKEIQESIDRQDANNFKVTVTGLLIFIAVILIL